MKKFLNELIWIKHTHYDNGTSERKLCVHPIVYFIVFILLIAGGYYAY